MAYPTADEIRDRWPIIGGWPVDDTVLDDLVAEFADLAERYRGVAFVSRTTTESVRGSDRVRLLLPDVEVSAVSAVSVDGSAFTGDELADLVVESAVGAVVGASVWSSCSIYVVTYDHGLSVTPPAVRRACAEWVRAKAGDFGVPEAPRNAISYQDPATGWSYRESTADWGAGRPTGVMVVDDALNSLPDRRVPAVA